MSDHPAVDVVITIRATVDPVFVAGMFDAARNATPIDGVLQFEVDGSLRR